jgi:hypothetical protein
MRWVTRLGIPLLLLFAAYTAWPFVDLYRLVHAIERQDLAELRRRVEFRTVTASLNRQILQSYLHLTGKEAQLGPFGQMLIGATSAQTDLAIEGLSGPQRLIDVMMAGRPASGQPESASSLLPRDVRGAWDLYANSEYSFDDFYVTIPPSLTEQQAFRIRLRLIRWTWKLHDVQLPDDLRTRLARRVMDTTGSN